MSQGQKEQLLSGGYDVSEVGQTGMCSFMGRGVLRGSLGGVVCQRDPNFEIRVHHGMATAMPSAGGMWGERVAAPTQQDCMLDTHDTDLTGNPNLGGAPPVQSVRGQFRNSGAPPHGHSHDACRGGVGRACGSTNTIAGHARHA